MLTWLPVEITGHKKLSNRDQRAPRKSPSNKRELKQCIAATKTQPRQVESSPVGSGWKDITCSVSFKRCWVPLFWNRKESFSSMTKYFKTPAVQCDDAKAWTPGRAGRLGDLTWDVFAAFMLKLVFRLLKLRLQWSNKQSKGSPSTEMYRSASSHGLEENHKCTVKVGQHAGEQFKWHETREGSAGRGEPGKRSKTGGGEASVRCCTALWGGSWS